MASGVDTITRADVEQTADSPAALTAGLFFCSICKSVYRQPKLLPCLHSFCRPCLVNLVTHTDQGSVIRCPLCLHHAPLPSSGVVGVPDNAFLNRICQDYVREIQKNIQGTPETVGVDQTSPATSPQFPSTSKSTSPSQAHGLRTTQPSRGRTSSSGRESRGVTRAHSEERDDEGNKIEETQGQRDPYASERGTPAGDGGDESTLDAIHNKNRLQAKVMGLQGEALRVTYAIDHINSWPEDWHTKREDLKRAVRAKSSQMQFAVKRAERALLAQIDEGGRAAEHKFLREAEAGKRSLRESLRNVLHEVTVLKSVRELGTDEEVNAMCVQLLGRSVGMSEVSLFTPEVSLECEVRPKETEDEMMRSEFTKKFGTLVFTEQKADVFKPEPVDFSSLPVEDFVSKASLGDEEDLQTEQVGAYTTVGGQIKSHIHPQPVTGIVETSVESTKEEQEDKNMSPAISGASAERKSRKRSTADKRRHRTDLGLDSPDVKAYLSQFQTARESFRTRRLEILQQGQLGRVSASPVRAMPSDTSQSGLEAVRARIRSSSRDSRAGSRGPSLDRSNLSSMAPLPAVVGTSAAAPGYMGRRGSAPAQRSHSLTRASVGASTPALGEPGPYTASTTSSKFLSARQTAMSQSREDIRASGITAGTRGSDSILGDNLQLQASPSSTPPYLSPQVQRRRTNSLTRSRRNSVDESATIENISPSAAADLLTQGETGAAESTSGGRVSSRPIRRAISSGADKRAKIEILRETWQRRKELLIQNEGFVTPGNRTDFYSPNTQPQIRSPPPSPASPASLRRRTNSASSSDSQDTQTSTSHITTQHPQVDESQSHRASTDLDKKLSTSMRDLQELNTTSTRPAVQLPFVSAVEVSSSYQTSLYSSNDSLPSHVLDSVKITIPEDNERISPVPESMKSPMFTETEQDSESYNEINEEGPKTSETDNSIQNDVKEEPIEEATENDLSNVQSSTAEPETPEEETVTTETIIITTPIHYSDKYRSQEDTFTLSTSIDKGEKTPLAKEETQKETTTTTEMTSSRATNAPTYFFRSRLTGLPVGGSAPPAESTKETTNIHSEPSTMSSLAGHHVDISTKEAASSENKQNTTVGSTLTETTAEISSAKSYLDIKAPDNDAHESQSSMPSSRDTTTISETRTYKEKEVTQASIDDNQTSDDDKPSNIVTETYTIPQGKLDSVKKTAAFDIEAKESGMDTGETITTIEIVSYKIPGRSHAIHDSTTTNKSDIRAFTFTSEDVAESTGVEYVDVNVVNREIIGSDDDAETATTTSEVIHPSTTTEWKETSSIHVDETREPSRVKTSIATTTSDVIEPVSTITVRPSVTETDNSSAPPQVGYFRSRLTGKLVGPPPTVLPPSPNTTTTTTAATDTYLATRRTSFVPFFKSRLTGQQVGQTNVTTTATTSTYDKSTTSTAETSTVSTSTNITASATTLSSRYPSRYNTESRYKPSESVDVASLIAAMYGGKEKKIISTSPEAGSSSASATTNPSVSTKTTTTTSQALTFETASTNTTASTTTTTSSVRQLPALRDPPTFYYTRRYNVSSASTNQKSSDSSKAGDVARTDERSTPKETGRYSSTPSQRYSSTERGLVTENTADSKNISQSHTPQSSVTYRQEATRSTHYTSESPPHTSSTTVTSILPVATTSTVGHTRSPIVHRRHTVEVSQSVISDALTTQTEQKLLDMPRPHLPDVIPETSVGIVTPREGIIRGHEHGFHPEVVTSVTEQESTNLFSKQGEVLHTTDQTLTHGDTDQIQASRTTVLPSKYSAFTSTDTLKDDIPQTTRTYTTQPRTSYHNTSSNTTTASELLRKAYSLDTEPEISQGISLTDAIRKSDPSYRHYTPSSRVIPEPLDLTGTTPSGSDMNVKDATPSPGAAPSRSPARSPSGSISPAMSPTSPQLGIRGKLKEIARKKKERWRHLTIH